LKTQWRKRRRPLPQRPNVDREMQKGIDVLQQT